MHLNMKTKRNSSMDKNVLFLPFSNSQSLIRISVCHSKKEEARQFFHYQFINPIETLFLLRFNTHSKCMPSHSNAHSKAYNYFSLAEKPQRFIIRNLRDFSKYSYKSITLDISVIFSSIQSSV